jgi:two-component system, LuxR family, sensor kinase FixL
MSLSARDTSDALFRTLIATAVDGIMVINGRGIVRIYSDACERLFGYKAEEVIGNNVNMLMPSPYREAHDSYLQHYHDTGEKRIIGIGREVTGKRKDGSTFPMYLSVGQGVINSEPIFVGIVHDLTVQKTAEARLVEVQGELLHVSRLSDMGQMASALAHELNQPLSAIMNYVNATKRTLEKGAEADLGKAREFIDKANEQTARAGQIIRNLRTFVEKREASKKTEGLNSIIQDSVSLGLVGAAADSNVVVSLELARGLPSVLADRVQIQQVVMNLTRNAIEAMEAVDRRELTVRTSVEDGGFVRVDVIDTGPGLAKEVMERLFQPFVTTKDSGMGIGLTICQSIVQAHDGRIWATPNSNGGTTFSFRLPFHEG